MSVRTTTEATFLLLLLPLVFESGVAPSAVVVEAKYEGGALVLNLVAVPTLATPPSNGLISTTGGVA